MILKIGRREFNVTNEDKVFFNGACYICITLKYFKEYHYISPTMSKTQANKLIKNGTLKLIKGEIAYTTSLGKDFWEKWYQFNIEEGE